MEGIRGNGLRRILAAALIALVCAAAFPVLSGDTAYAASLNCSGRLNTSVYLRKSWSTSSRSLGSMKKNTSLNVRYEVNTSGTNTSSSTRWYAVNAGSRSGFVKVNRVKITRCAHVAAYTTEAVNYRTGPATSFRKLGTAKAGTRVSILIPAKCPGGATWYKVNVNGRTGYIHGSYISIGTYGSSIETGIASAFKNEFTNLINSIRTSPAKELNKKSTIGGNTRVVYTFDSSNCKKLFAITGYGETQVPQAFTFTGKEYYVLYGMDNSQCIVTYNENGKRIKSTPFPKNYGHLNGITWDPKTKLCYIFKGCQTTIYTWNPANGQFGTATTQFSSSGVGYDNVTDILYASSETCIRKYSADGKFTYLGKITRCEPNMSHSVQDCGACNGYVFHGITSTRNRFLNYLDVYRAKDGKYMGSIKVTMDEIESVVVGNDGYVQLIINTDQRTDYVWKTPLNVRDLK